MGTAQTSVETAIRVRLASAKKSQRALADQLGVTPSWLSRRMSGRKAFTTDDLGLIAEALGTDFVGLITTGQVAA